LKELFDHGRLVSLVLPWDCMGPLACVPEGLDALPDFVLHLEIVEIRLERVERQDAGDVFLGSWESGEVVCWHVGSLFVLYNEVMLQ
jgi:hypothetical protein